MKLSQDVDKIVRTTLISIVTAGYITFALNIVMAEHLHDTVGFTIVDAAASASAIWFFWILLRTLANFFGEGRTLSDKVGIFVTSLLFIAIFFALARIVFARVGHPILTAGSIYVLLLTNTVLVLVKVLRSSSHKKS